MANTNDLKSKIEPAILHAFWRKIGATPIDRTSALFDSFQGMKMDGAGFRPSDKCLVIAEATTSGYLGHGKNDFHTGAVRKLADSFSRFSILNYPRNKRAILASASKATGMKLREVECHFVVPEGSRFLKALGYRDVLFQMDVMSLTEVRLSPHHRRTLERVLHEAQNEMG